MSKVVEERRVIRVTTTWGYDRDMALKYIYIPTKDNDHKGATLRAHEGYRGVDDLRDATDMNTFPEDRVMRMFFSIKERLCAKSSIDLVNLKLTMEATPVTFDEDEMREYLRATALKKLSEDEIIALGVGNLAIYDKLKNHNA
jgi:hypothetical protein